MEITDIQDNSLFSELTLEEQAGITGGGFSLSNVWRAAGNAIGGPAGAGIGGSIGSVLGRQASQSASGAVIGAVVGGPVGANALISWLADYNNRLRYYANWLYL